MRECDWRSIKKNINVPPTDIPRIYFSDTEDTLLTAIERDEVFGFVLADVTTPDHVRDQFGSFLFPPIIRRMQVNATHMSEYMKQLCREENTVMKFNTLVQTYNCEQELLMTPLVKMYMKRGMIVKNVTKFIQYTAGRGKYFEYFKHYKYLRSTSLCEASCGHADRGEAIRG